MEILEDVFEIKGWFCRLGNNIAQLRNVISAGIYYNKNVIIPPHPYFNQRFIQIVDPLPEQDQTMTSFVDIEGTHFFYYDRITKLSADAFLQNREKVQEIMQDIFTIKYDLYETLGDKDVVIHIRSGDIFDANPHGGYIMPPLSFYVEIIETNQFENIFIVAEDTKNPCVNELIRLYPHIQFTINRLEEDVELILRARHIICSYGTFVHSLLYMTKYTYSIYKINWCFTETVKNIKHIVLDYSEYKKKINIWKNTREQCELLLTYKNP